MCRVRCVPGKYSIYLVVIDTATGYPLSVKRGDFVFDGRGDFNKTNIYRWVARLRHRTSVLKVNIDARAHCQYSTTANVCFHMATGVGKFNNMRLYLALKRFVCEFDGWDRCFTRFLLMCTT